MAADLPRKAPKAAKPLRQGVAYVAMRPDGAVLVETRPASGLLGGMLGLPGTAWVEEAPGARPPVVADWRDAGVEVRHVFTHFALSLRVATARVPASIAPHGDWRAPGATLEKAMPTVMRKALRAGLSALAET